MKKIHLLFFGLFIFTPLFAFAVSGACSSHGGVNCSAGASSSGNAVCNDGWESSTSYYNTDECKTNITDYCILPHIYGCTEESSYTQDQDLCAQYQAQGVSTNYFCIQAIQCRSEIDTYNAVMKTFNQCLNSRLSLSACHGDPNSTYNSTTKDCACNNGYTMYSETNGLNHCIDQVTLQKNQDASASKWCSQQNNAVYQDGQCLCLIGYKVDSQQQCVAKEKKEISAKAKNWVDNSGGPCVNGGMSETETSECVDYQLHKDSYTWVVSNPSTTEKSTVIPTKVQNIILSPSTSTIINKPVVSIPKKSIVTQIGHSTSTPTTTTLIRATTSPIQTIKMPTTSFWYKAGAFISKLNPFSWFK
jgi:hypothetical protein